MCGIGSLFGIRVQIQEAPEYGSGSKTGYKFLFRKLVFSNTWQLPGFSNPVILLLFDYKTRLLQCKNFYGKPKMGYYVPMPTRRSNNKNCFFWHARGRSSNKPKLYHKPSHQEKQVGEREGEKKLTAGIDTEATVKMGSIRAFFTFFLQMDILVSMGFLQCFGSGFRGV